MSQLDFIGTSLNKRTQQLQFLDDKNRIHFQKSDEHDVDKYFASIKTEEVERHTEHWIKLIPQNLDQVFKRFLFSFTSVHTGFESNMRGYSAIKNWSEWMNDDAELKNRLHNSGVGLTNNRTRFISQFARKFWSNPEFYEKQVGETWIGYRNRLENDILGLGPAKTSFALEMVNPLTAEVFCADVHLFRFYGYDQSIHGSKYSEIENHWIQKSKLWSVPSYMARSIFWNRQKGQKDCSYWTNVFN
jgi:thermostable 8-oxoguanine DNA glycosylase